MYELRMKRPRARAGRTPISSSVLTADDEPEPELGVGGGGEPCIVGGITRCIGGRGWMGAAPAGTGADSTAATGDIEGGVGGAGESCAEAPGCDVAGDWEATGAGATPEDAGRRCGSL